MKSTEDPSYEGSCSGFIVFAISGLLHAQLLFDLGDHVSLHCLDHALDLFFKVLDLLLNIAQQLLAICCAEY